MDTPNLDLVLRKAEKLQNTHILDIKERTDARETWHEGDWIRSIPRAIREARRKALEEAMKEVRDRCEACNGGYTGEQDAGGDWLECEYCGRPMRAIGFLFTER